VREREASRWLALFRPHPRKMMSIGLAKSRQGFGPLVLFLSLRRRLQRGLFLLYLGFLDQIIARRFSTRNFRFVSRWAHSPERLGSGGWYGVRSP